MQKNTQYLVKLYKQGQKALKFTNPSSHGLIHFICIKIVLCCNFLFIATFGFLFDANGRKSKLNNTAQGVRNII
jgi:hypothetical protein